MSTQTQRDGLQIAWKSDVGVQRDGNEDVVVCEADLGLFAVIDGVGGEVAGERGAAEAAEVLKRRLRRQEGSLERQIREAVALANNRLLELAQDDPSLRGMSCVLTLAVLREGEIVVGHVGDTRLYLVQRSGLQKISSDHSPVGQMEEMGELSEAEAMRHPRRNEIFRDVGSTWREPDDPDFLEVYRETFFEDQALLICSDGLTDQVTSAKIFEVLRRYAGHPAAASDELVRLANEAGGKDNVSLVLVEGEKYAEGMLQAERLEDELGETRRMRLPVDTQGAIDAARRSRAEALAASEAETRDLSPYRKPDIKGAAAAKPSAGSRLLLAALAILFLSGVWLLFGAPGAPAPVRERVEPWTRLVGLGPSWTLEVGPDRSYASLSAALSVARGGDVILVDDGMYEERIVLRSGVTLRARNPRGATLLTSAEGTLDEGVLMLGEQVSGARIEDFRISAAGRPPNDEGSTVGSSDALPLDSAIRLIDSQVELVGLEISGTNSAAIDLVGADRSVVARSFLHDHQGACVRVSPTAASEIVDNLLVRCGLGGADPAVDVRAAVRSQVRGNEFQGNRIGIWAGTRPLEELRLANDFDTDSEMQVLSGPRLDSAPATSSRAP